MYLEFRSPLAVCLRVNILSNALQDALRECILLSVYVLPFILCFVFVDSIVLYSYDVFSLLFGFSFYAFVGLHLWMILRVSDIYYAFCFPILPLVRCVTELYARIYMIDIYRDISFCTLLYHNTSVLSCKIIIASLAINEEKISNNCHLQMTIFEIN